MQIINSNLITYASALAPLPTAKVFTEGIYHFDNSVGKKLTLKLITPDKPVTLILIDDSNNKLRCYLDFNSTTESIDIYLSKPLNKHTTILKGDGQLSFTFED